MSSLSPRERVLAILSGKSVDRLPVDCWFTSEAYESLYNHVGAESERDLYTRTGLDRIKWLPDTYKGKMRAKPYEGAFVTPWGNVLKPVQSGKAVYMEYDGHPLAHLNALEELKDYPYFPDVDKYDYDDILKTADEWCDSFAIMGPWVSFFETYCQLRGLETAMMDLLADPDFTNALLDKIEKIHMGLLEEVFSRANGRIDMALVSDDMGTQRDLMIGLDSWQEYIQPRLKRMCDLIHSYGVKVMYHTDGAVRPLIPHLIEAGIDILNPIQHACPGMEMEQLKNDFGDQLVFYGGVDTQKALPFGSVEDVIAETEHCMKTLGDGNRGYICASCHNVQAGTPPENMLAMIETVHRLTRTVI